ncbi:hypothetical protein HYG87_08355 [Methanobacterium alkalithermotolerans]|uniref:Uncharacterized protein n=1 Tax=Methanobacterium alkalithermotolerans TaxID=2731220 RepID=A0A8T8K777_9EURY|nr:hypothetical protein [Methanobacterium alkalithermotolerans]QUH23769.1 hypothetical protein HYG87_08355 [Methanobacterium alkalithermotolerans]
MNKDYKLIGTLIPVLLVLSVGLYGIPGAVGDSTNQEGIDLIDIWSLQFRGMDNSTEELEVEEEDIPDPADNSNPNNNRPPVYNPQPSNPTTPSNPTPEPEPPSNGDNSE